MTCAGDTGMFQVQVTDSIPEVLWVESLIKPFLELLTPLMRGRNHAEQFSPEPGGFHFRLCLVNITLSVNNSDQ